MKLWVVIPAKPFHLGKSRLSSVLSCRQRTVLNEYLFVSTLQKVQNLGAGTIVVSSSTALLENARRLGATPVIEPVDSGLNHAVSIGTATAERLGATDILIVPTDLPSAGTDDFAKFVAISDAAVSVSIATDCTREGTNALHLKQTRGFPFRFGKRSAQRHILECVGAGVAWFRAPPGPLAFDLDTSNDLARVCREQPGAFLASYGGLLTRAG